MKYFIYCRKSSEREDHQILSIESQLKALTTLAKEQKLEIVDIYQETKTAYKTGRPMFNEMLARIEKGEANGVIVFHLTRIARNSFDGGRFIYMMDEGIIKEIITPETTYINISDHKFLMQIHFAMAKKSSDDTSTFVKRDNQAKLDKGEIIGLAPIGYLNIDKEGRIAGKQYDLKKQELLIKLDRPLNRLEIDPIDGYLVKKLFTKASSGQYSAVQLLKYAKNLGLEGRRAPLNKSMIQKILKNKVYCGLITCKSIEYIGDYEKLISRSLFDKVQENLQYRSKPRGIKHNKAYTGFIRCGECGCMITAEIQKGNCYYRCTKKKGNCNQKYIRKEGLEIQILDYLKKVSIPQEFVEWALEELRETFGNELKQQENIRIQKQKELNRVKNIRERLLETYLEDEGVLSKEEYLEQKPKLQQRIDELKVQIDNNDNSESNWIDDCESFFDFSKNIISSFQKSPIEEKKNILQSIGSNFVLKDKKLSLEYQEIYKPFIKICEYEEKERLELQESVLNNSKNSTSDAKLKIWGE